MTITLYKISDDRRQLNKSLTLAHTVATLTNAHYKEDTDILNPVIEIAYNSQYTGVNYIHVSDWNRYYFVKGIKTGMQRLFLECEVDVLTTYKTDIKKLVCVVQRQENSNNANRYLPDGMFRATARQVISTPYKFPQGFTKNQSIIMTTGGKS